MTWAEKKAEEWCKETDLWYEPERHDWVKCTTQLITEARKQGIEEMRDAVRELTDSHVFVDKIAQRLLEESDD